ncbi:MAG: dipeptide epimerase [Hyphomicrobiales bacterium]|nr:MAG: dipeptide epimerase [Hyphomicrobiales bacterium]
MRIVKAEIFKARIALKMPFKTALGSGQATETLFIRLHTDDGLVGMGEASYMGTVVGETLSTGAAAAVEYARLLLDKNPLALKPLTKQMRSLLPNNPTTRSALDMALYDIVGQAVGMPIYALLGGERRPLTTDMTIGIDTPEAMTRTARDYVDRGFSAIKIKLGTAYREDIERVSRIRAEVGDDIQLRVDANQGWDHVTALKVLRELSSLDIQYCEQPVPACDLEGITYLRQLSPVPIMADEAVFDQYDAFRLIKRESCDYINIKLAKSGGIDTAMSISSVAEAAGIKCMIGCMAESRLGLTASAHLASALDNIVFYDLDGAEMHIDDPIEGGLVYHHGGEIELPTAPGLGATIDQTFLDQLEKISVTS